MSVVIEAFSVVVRNATLTAQYPGGVGGFHRDCPNATFCADEHLSRISFMVREDAESFIAQMAEKGLTPYRKGASEDVALIESDGGLLRPCDWLEVGRWGKATIVWLAGTKAGDMHAPMNWNADRQVLVVSGKDKDRLRFLRSDKNVDVYWDEATKRELYVGRTAHGSEQSGQRKA